MKFIFVSHYLQKSENIVAKLAFTYAHVNHWKMFISTPEAF